MISIIVSSYKQDYFNQFSLNVEKTIGVPYEIIQINNPGVMGICEAYNQGAEKASFQTLCFCHEDIAFLVSDWGYELIKLLAAPHVGLIGVAGSKIKTSLPTGWTSGLGRTYDLMTAVQNGSSSTDEFENINKSDPPISVKVIDGLFIACKKKTWQEVKFNDQIKGFHFYDIDFSLRVADKYQNFLLPTLKIAHFSEGNFNDSWIKAAIRFHQDGKRRYTFDAVSKKQQDIIRFYWYNRLQQETISFSSRLRYAAQMGVGLRSVRTLAGFLLK